MGIVSEVIGELENFSITKEALEATRLGKHINELRRKASDKLLANRAKSLVKKWRALLSDTGQPPGGGAGANAGGGNNNNSLAATNGNTAARLSSAAAPVVIVSPGLPSSGSRSGSSNISPGLPVNHHHPHPRQLQQLHNQQRGSNLSPGMPPRTVLSPGLAIQRNNMSPGLSTPGAAVVRSSAGGSSVPNSLSGGGVRSARASPSLSRSATPRVSPATVTISSSGGSSPNHSRPTSPQGFAPINPPVPSVPNSRSPSPDIQIIEEVVKTPRVHKRMRRDESQPRLDNKRPKLDFGHQTQQQQQQLQQHVLNGTDGVARDGANASSDNPGRLLANPTSANRPRNKNLNNHNHHPNNHQPNNHQQQQQREKPSMLNKQISMAKRSGKVKTTQELIENLGIDSSRHSADANNGGGGSGQTPQAGAQSGTQPHSSIGNSSVNNLVPAENKEELMHRFFQSQQHQRLHQHEVDDDDDDCAVEIISRPGSSASASLQLGTNSSRSAVAGIGGERLPPSSSSVSQVSSRVNTPVGGGGAAATHQPGVASSSSTTLPGVNGPPGGAAISTKTAPGGPQSVEDVLALLEPIDPAAVLAEWEAKTDAETQPETDDGELLGLPVDNADTATENGSSSKPKLEITEQVVRDLNQGQLEHIGGVTDCEGVFREWHEMVARQTLGGQLLNILPYSVID